MNSQTKKYSDFIKRNKIWVGKTGFFSVNYKDNYVIGEVRKSWLYAEWYGYLLNGKQIQKKFKTKKEAIYYTIIKHPKIFGILK